jgi:hypothetical protein
MKSQLVPVELTSQVLAAATASSVCQLISHILTRSCLSPYAFRQIWVSSIGHTPTQLG